MVGRSIATQRSTYLSLSLVWRQALQLQLHTHLQHLHRRKPWLPRSIQHQQEVRVWVKQYLSHKPAEIENPNQNDVNREVRWNLSHDLPEWLQEFTHGLVDESVPEHRDASSSSQELLLEPRATAVSGSGEQSVLTHFPKDRNCEICQRTKITGAPCRRRIGGVVPRAEKFGDLITADHKVLSESCESRNNHRYAIVVQDLATQWIQSYPCKTKTSQETQKSLQKFLEPNRKPKVTYTDNSLEFGKACKDLSWIILRQHRRLLKERHAEWKKGHLRYCCNQVWTMNGGRIPWNAIPICETFKISCLMGRHITQGGSECPLTDQ